MEKKDDTLCLFVKWFNMNMSILPRLIYKFSMIPPKINSKIVIGIWHFGPEEIWENNSKTSQRKF